MSSARPYLELTLHEWLSELSAPTPAPAGGSALAYAAATAAAVLVCAARASQDSWQNALGALAQAQTLRDRAAPLAQRDADAYTAVYERRRTAAASPGDEHERALGEAFARAAEPPLEIAQVAADVARLAAEIAAKGDPSVYADAAAAAALAAAAARGAVDLIAVNLTVADDDPRLGEAHRLAEEAAEALSATAARAPHR